MENVIRNGELQLLISETPCDVILSCEGRKLTAHKLMLSIASPILQDLLVQDSAEITTLIFPDASANAMSKILEYIYNGSVTISAYFLKEFISVAALLKIDIKVENALNATDDIDIDSKSDIPDKKPLKRMPNLMPISMLMQRTCDNVRKKSLYNRVFPSPWSPRNGPLLADPREAYSCVPRPHIYPLQKEAVINDTNNNFYTRNYLQFQHVHHEQYYNERATPSSCHSSSNSKDIFPEKSDPEGISNDDKANDAEIVAHLKTESGKNSVQSQSPLCTSSEDNDDALSDDKKEGASEKPEKAYKCHDCGKTFSQLRNYKYHRSVHEGTKEFAARCPECGKVFNDRGYLSSHLKIHRDRKEYACSHCPKRFNQRVAYNMHLRIHTGVKPHECPTCSKTFSRKMLLKQHQRVHTGERPYSCPECGKRFADRSNMSLHARLHTGVKPYACNLCNKSFTKKHHLKTHMNFHTGLKPYSCQNCGLSFSQSSNMRTHYKKCMLK